MGQQYNVIIKQRANETIPSIGLQTNIQFQRQQIATGCYWSIHT